ncbi:nuclear factor NF-kappa-B p110 subunit isoform X2 [Copidosoma floridanum]|nr:nuclear factor NF-kappa-B p110 subunit isoform X2 [Copidosoma floridanum]
MSTAGNYSPSSLESPLEMEVTEHYSTEQYVDMINQSEIISILTPELKIIVQPVDKFRFRYKSEMMGTHGSLLGEREDSTHKKEVPTVQLINCPMKNAVIRCTLVTADEDRRFPHAHHLVRKDGNVDKDDPHDIEVSDENNYTAMFCNMGIIHTAKKNIKEEIIRKKTIELKEEKKRKDPNDTTISIREDLQMKCEAEEAQKWMNLNSVALCFQALYYGEDNVLHPVTDKIYSRPINNLKSALTGELKICRIDKHTSSCEGNEEIWLLVEKVGRKNIKVKFYEVDDRDNVIWDAEGRFSELDVHHQYAITLRTPPYKDLNITSPVQVFLKLERPSDGETSNILKFHYKPSDKVLSRKRPRLSSTSKSFEEIQNRPLSMPMAETYTNFNDFNVSEEIRKLTVAENFPKDLKDFVLSSSFEDYLSLLSSQTTEQGNLLTPGLTTDGIDKTELDKAYEDFAKDTLKKIMSVLKEIEASHGTQEEATRKVQDLLQETTYYGDGPLHFALRYEQYETAKNIIMVLAVDPSLKNIVDLQNSAGQTALHLAVLQGKSDIVRPLLKLGADPNQCDEVDANALHCAVIVEANACIDELLKSDQKINLEAHNESGWSALHLAAKVGSLHAVRALVEANADINSTDMSYGRTALHIAVDFNHKHIVKFLLKNTSIDVNMRNFGGNTALHSAVVKGGRCAEELVKILKEYDADPRIRNNNASRDTEEERSDSPILELPSETISEPSNQLPSEKISERLSKRFCEIPKECSLSKRSSLQLSDQRSKQIRGEITSSMELLTTIKSENENFGESSFDLARNDPTLIQLLNGAERPPDIVHEELDLKEESDDDIALQQRAIMNIRSIVKESFVSKPTFPAIPTPKKRGRKKKQPIELQQLQQEQKRQQQLEQLGQGDEKLTEMHIKRLTPVLDKTGDWEKLAQHMSQGSLIRLLKKADSPSTSLFRKLKLTHPNLTVRQMKKLLIEVQSFEAATELEIR